MIDKIILRTWAFATLGPNQVAKGVYYMTELESTLSIVLILLQIYLIVISDKSPS